MNLSAVIATKVGVSKQIIVGRDSSRPIRLPLLGLNELRPYKIDHAQSARCAIRPAVL
jgi:hypothetical protein